MNKVNVFNNYRSIIIALLNQKLFLFTTKYFVRSKHHLERFQKIFPFPTDIYFRTLPTTHSWPTIAQHTNKPNRVIVLSIWRVFVVFYCIFKHMREKKCGKYFSTLCDIFVQFHFIFNCLAVRLCILPWKLVFKVPTHILMIFAYFLRLYNIIIFLNKNSTKSTKLSKN